MSELIQRIEEAAKGKGLTFNRIERDCGLGNGTIKRWSTHKARASTSSFSSPIISGSRSTTSSTEHSERIALRKERSRISRRRRNARVSPVTAYLWPRTRWILSPCIGSSRRPIERRSSTSSTSSTSGKSRRKKTLSIRHISTGARTKKAAPLGAVRPATEPPNFFVLP